MKPRSEPRIIPQTRRYFAVTLEDGQVFDLRFPSYGQASAMVTMFNGLKDESDLAALSLMLDVAGYAIGLCWCHRHFDLESGTAPVLDFTTVNSWHRYGDDVIDEIQEFGLSLSDIMQILNAIIAEFGTQMAGVKEARVLGEALPATTGA